MTVIRENENSETYVDHHRCNSVAMINNFRSQLFALITFLLHHAHTQYLTSWLAYLFSVTYMYLLTYLSATAP